MASGTTVKRPFTVTIVGLLIAIAAIANIWVGVMLILASIGDNPTFINIYGQEQTVSTFYLWFNGGLFILLGLIYFWLTRLTFAGSTTAQVLISVLAVLNIVFGFFHLGYGGGVQIIINLIIVLIVNGAKARVWFSQSA